MGPKMSAPAPAPAPPPPPPPPPTPAQIAAPAEDEAKNQENLLRQRRAAASTILTSGTGLNTPAPTAAKSILGG